MKLKSVVLAGVLALCGVAVSVAPTYAVVECPEGSLRAEEPDKTANSYAECNLPRKEAGDPDFWQTVMQVLNVLVGVVGVVAVAVIILGGITFVTSQGDAAKVTRAKNTIIYGLVGLVIAALAFAIVRFVLNNAFKSASSGNSTTTTVDPTAPTSGDN